MTGGLIGGDRQIPVGARLMAIWLYSQTSRKWLPRMSSLGGHLQELTPQ